MRCAQDDDLEEAMAVFKMEPPPETDDIRVLRAWANEMYEQVSFVLGHLDGDNFEDEFMDNLNIGS